MLTAAVRGGNLLALTSLGAVSEEQLSALLARIKEDPSLRKKLQDAADLDAFVAMAKEAGFEVSEEDLKTSVGLSNLLTDAELEKVAGGADYGCAAANSKGISYDGPCDWTYGNSDGDLVREDSSIGWIEQRKNC